MKQGSVLSLYLIHVVIAKLTYAASASNSTDRQRIEAFVRRGIRCGFCCSDNKTIQQLVEESNQSLFKRVLNDTYHVLNCLLPDERHYCYNLRDRAHNRELHIMSRLLDCNFLTRLLFKDSY